MARSREFARGELPPFVACEGNKPHLFSETARDHGKPHRSKTPVDAVRVEEKEHGQRLVYWVALAYALPILLTVATLSQEGSTSFLFFCRETQNRAPRLEEQLKSLAGGGRGEPGAIAKRGAACEDVRQPGEARGDARISRNLLLRTSVPVGLLREPLARNESAMRCASISGPSSPEVAVVKNTPPPARWGTYELTA